MFNCVSKLYKTISSDCKHDVFYVHNVSPTAYAPRNKSHEQYSLFVVRGLSFRVLFKTQNKKQKKSQNNSI